MKTYEEEFNGSEAPLLPKLKILCETEKKIGTSKERGMNFFKTFFRRNNLAQ
jgi:hypothetical protein